MAMVIMVMVVKSWNVKCSSFQFSDGYGDYGDGCESWNVKFSCSSVFQMVMAIMVMVVKSWNVKCSSLHFSDDYGDYGDGCEVMECSSSS